MVSDITVGMYSLAVIALCQSVQLGLRFWKRR